MNAVDLLGWYSPLSRACGLVCTDLAIRLLDSGADPNFIERRDGYAPLTRASIDLNEDLVRKLIEMNADVNLSTYIGSTSLLATLAVNRGILRYLEQASDKPNENTNKNILPFPVSANRLGMISEAQIVALETVVRILLENSASPFIRNRDGQNPTTFLSQVFFLVG